MTKGIQEPVTIQQARPLAMIETHITYRRQF